MGLQLINKLRANVRHGVLATVNTGGARPIHLTNRSKEGACPNPVPWCPACLKGRDWDRGGDTWRKNRAKNSLKKVLVQCMSALIVTRYAGKAVSSLISLHAWP